MAFVFKADRFNKKNEDLNVGPGSYDLRMEQKKQHGYAPFGSTSVKQKPPKEEKPKKKTKFSTEEIKRLREELPQPMFDSMTKKQMSSFASKSKRFKKPKSEVVPGPGNYEAYGFTDELGKKMFYQEQREIAKM